MVKPGECKHTMEPWTLDATFSPGIRIHVYDGRYHRKQVQEIVKELVEWLVYSWEAPKP
jgi:hypothetical protein